MNVTCFYNPTPTLSSSILIAGFWIQVVRERSIVHCDIIKSGTNIYHTITSLNDKFNSKLFFHDSDIIFKSLIKISQRSFSQWLVSCAFLSPKVISLNLLCGGSISAAKQFPSTDCTNAFFFFKRRFLL